jgi:TadE-like protein
MPAGGRDDHDPLEAAVIRLTARSTRRARGRREGGQALVEFAVAVVPFLFLLMGVIDLGRGIYLMNGTSEAAREIARVTSVHLKGGGAVGMSADTLEVVTTQRRLVPGLDIDPAADIECVDQFDAVIADSACRPEIHFVRVRVEAPFAPVTPILSLFGNHTFASTSRVEVQVP